MGLPVIYIAGRWSPDQRSFLRPNGRRAKESVYTVDCFVGQMTFSQWRNEGLG